MRLKQLLEEQNKLLSEIRDLLTVRKRTQKQSYETAFDLDAVYKMYPRKEGKTKGFEILAKKITSQKKYDELIKATKCYRDRVIYNKTEKKFMLMFSTFATRYMDYLEEDQLTLKPVAPKITEETKFLI